MRDRAATNKDQQSNQALDLYQRNGYLGGLVFYVGVRTEFVGQYSGLNGTEHEKKTIA